MLTLPRRTPHWVLPLCLGAGFTTLLDQSILNGAVPALRASLNAGQVSLQWIVAGYSLTFGLALVPAGRLGDTRGRKTLFIGGLVLFAAGSVMAATASTPWVLALARLVQGAGAGTVNPQVIGLIQDHFVGPRRARALGAYVVVGALGGSVGPVVAGLVLSVTPADLGWRLVLLANVPFGVATALLAVALLPGRVMTVRRSDLDLVGLVLLGLGTLALLLPFVQPSRSVATAAAWTTTAVLTLAGFVFWELRYARRGGLAVLLPELRRSVGFILGTLVAMFSFGSSLASSLILVLFLQDGFGFSPWAAALVSLPGAVTLGLSAAWSWRLVSRFGRAVVSVALALAAVALVASWLLSRHLQTTGLAIGLALCQAASGVAAGLSISPNQALTLGHAPAGVAGVSAGFLQLSQRLTATIAVAAVSGIFLGTASVGQPGSYRSAFGYGLGVCLAMVLLSLTFSIVDGYRTRPRRGRDVVPADP